MTADYAEEIAANLARAELSWQAAQELAARGFYDFAASRAYYVTFYAATALLLRDGLELSKHSGVIASIHQHYVKTGRLAKELGKTLNWLFELRGIGDYGVTVHVSQQEAERALQAAKDFLDAIKQVLQQTEPA